MVKIVHADMSACDVGDRADVYAIGVCLALECAAMQLNNAADYGGPAMRALLRSSFFFVDASAAYRHGTHCTHCTLPGVERAYYRCVCVPGADDGDFLCAFAARLSRALRPLVERALRVSDGSASIIMTCFHVAHPCVCRRGLYALLRRRRYGQGAQASEGAPCAGGPFHRVSQLMWSRRCRVADRLAVRAVAISTGRSRTRCKCACRV